MLVCDAWLRTDWLVRAGFTLTTTPDGTRTARRDHTIVLLPAVCGHPPEICPPHVTQARKDEAA
jgi:hypothetical protein